jgi:mannose/fructose/N-acetylgalactosamine-specific phosphotransferase system component IIC
MRLSTARHRKPVVVALALGLVLGFVGTAIATETWYVGDSTTWGTIPQQGSGASTAGVAIRTSNTARTQTAASCPGNVKAYYITSSGSVFSSITCSSPGPIVQLGSSGSTSVYSRCSTVGAFTESGRCSTVW